MRIAIDGRPLLHRPVGIANFLISALNKLVDIKPDWEFYVFVNRNIDPVCLGKIKQINKIKFVKAPLWILPSISTLWFIFKLPSLLNELKPDVFWAPANITTFGVSKKIKTLLTVQDLVNKKHSKTMLVYERILHNVLFNYSVKRADIIWTISRSTEQELIACYPRVADKKRIRGCSIEDGLFKKTELSPVEVKSFLNRHGLGDRKFLLFVGTIEPRKNLVFLLKLMRNASLQNLDLAVVGAKGWGGVKEIEKIMNENGLLKNRVHFLSFVSSEDLISLYNVAEALVMPSMYEGFGLPILEAMSCGCPVVTAHNSGMVEVVGDSGITVNGWNEDIWAGAILKALAERIYYSEKGLKHIKNFNWGNIVKDVISAIGK